MSDHLSVLIDGSDPAISYGPGWTAVDRPFSSTFIGGSVMAGSGNLSVKSSFHGTSISIYGYLNTSQTPSIQIDNATIQGTYLDLPYYGPWYTSSFVTDHQHDFNMSLDNATHALIDYMVVTAGPSTPLEGRTIIADDFDKDIQYSGSWETQFGTVFPARDTNGTGRLAFRNTTHSTKKSGSRFTFDFTGSSISVFGILQSRLGGKWTAKFSVDGGSSNVYTAEFSNSTMRSFDRTNIQLYHTDLKPGSHVLDVQVSEMSGDQSFVLDYILYNASFANALSKPQPQPKAVAAPKIPLGATVGAVAGAAVIIILLILLLWRRKHNTVNIKGQPVDLTQHDEMTSQESRPVSTRGHFHRKSFRHSNATLVDQIDPPSPPSLPQLPSFAFPSNSASPSSPYENDGGIQRIDPYTTSPTRTKPHYRKKSEMMGSFDSKAYPSSSQASFFPLHHPSASQQSFDAHHTSTSFHGSHSSIDLSAYSLGSPNATLPSPIPPVPHNPYLGRKTSLGHVSRRSKSYIDPHAEPVTRPTSAHSRMGRHQRNSSYVSFQYAGSLPQAEIRRRTQEIYEMVARLETDISLAAAAGSEGDVAELRNRIEVLTRENGRLQQAAPGAQLPAINTDVDNRPGGSGEEPPPAYHHSQGPMTC
ncbi:hypothetical protein HGRIS_003215 [Hohenbuehelia grisea]|uniref:Uncharacterized protein n=1 Tax=Hohenbuehelia grisea TaxID=104357 RepID=A0ABR3JP60_9AGAR